MTSIAPLPSPAPKADAAWHTSALDELVARLATDPHRGLADAEAGRRLAQHGPNALAEQPAAPWWWKFLRQFADLVIWILLVAAVIAGAMGDWADTAAIAAIVLVNALIGFLQEERALKALAALERMSAPLAKVVRDGAVRAIPARDLVPGDLVELDAGDHVPADARIRDGYGLRLQESSLTGESTPVEKEPVERLPAATPLADRRSMVHAGTIVAAGRAVAIVVATGMETELGRIAGMLARATPEATPLQRRLAELGRILIVVCLAIVGIIFALELARGGGPAALWRSGGLADVLLRAVSLAVAAVPEGLPAVVTLVLAIGLQRMVARNALVRRLPSVETLGSVTVICSDKTGTLTRNEMTVREIVTASGSYRVSGVGYAPQGEFQRTSGMASRAASVEPDLERLLTIAARCNNATVQPSGADGWQVVGDPTEGALVVAAMKAGIAIDDPATPTIFEIPFDSERKRMSVVVRQPDGLRLLETKGAPEAVLPCCVAEWRDGAAVPLTAERRREILAAGASLANAALRVLSLACRELPPHESIDSQPALVERELVHVGLAGLIDPPREEAKAAVERCRSAGIRPVMITGDHPATAMAIGRELGITDGAPGRVVTGAELESMSDDRLTATVADIDIYARVSAEHKLRVVRAWQRRGAVVAMTGDGVNDAPAVKAADIGIAMGITGTDVTKEASDMVLTDDNFASIVSAVEEGRGIYDNIQKFIHYLLSCNAGEVILMFAAAVAGWPAPLAAIQILWLNLVTDGLPALALGLEPPERDLMLRQPRPPQEAVITLRRGLLILAHGALVAAVMIVAFWLSWQGDASRLPHARTMTFCVAAFAQLFFAIGCRSDRATAVELGFFRNPALLAAIAISSLLQVTIVTLPHAQSVFAVGSSLGSDWLLVLALALVPVTTVELLKWFAFRGT
ncbi:MAG: cation-translocating P-type ATPase [Planctomycetia bacterium]|jgi:Ca2+-transporting ATPase